MKRVAQEYYQYNQKFISLTLDYKTINTNSEVLIYGEHKYGYQRAVNELHLNRMVSTLQNTNEILSPTSILLGVAPEEISNCLTILDVDTDKINKKEKVLMFDTEKIGFKFRIIDGQHRIKAFEKIFTDTKTDQSRKFELEEYMFNVIIAVIPENERLQEVELFRTINSKAKPLKTDLAMLAKYNFEFMNKKTEIDFNEHVKTRIIFYLNDEDIIKTDTCWKNGIKVDVNNRKAIGSVGFKAFGDSIDKIVSIYLKQKDNELQIIKKEVESLDSEAAYDLINQFLESSALDILQNLIIPAWEIIYSKWEKAFKSTLISSEGTKQRIFYNDDYYIQQTMGVKSLNGLITQYYEENKDFAMTISIFDEVINASSLSEADWKKDGKMKGLSSESGFKIIRGMISTKLN